jgi:hypothetical protein
MATEDALAEVGRDEGLATHAMARLAVSLTTLMAPWMATPRRAAGASSV